MNVIAQEWSTEELAAHIRTADNLSAMRAIEVYRRNVAALNGLTRRGSRLASAALGLDLARKIGFPGGAKFIVTDNEIRAYVGPLGAYYTRVYYIGEHRCDAWSLTTAVGDRDPWWGAWIATDHRWSPGRDRREL